CPGAAEDHQAILLEPGLLRGVGDEVEHGLRLVGRELADVAKGLDVALGNDEEVDVGLGVDVLDREQPIGAVDDGRRKLAAMDLAEDAVRDAHAARIPSSTTAAPRTRTSSPTGASTSHGE